MECKIIFSRLNAGAVNFLLSGSLFTGLWIKSVPAYFYLFPLFDFKFILAYFPVVFSNHLSNEAVFFRESRKSL